MRRQLVEDEWPARACSAELLGEPAARQRLSASPQRARGGVVLAIGHALHHGARDHGQPGHPGASNRAGRLVLHRGRAEGLGACSAWCCLRLTPLGWSRGRRARARVALPRGPRERAQALPPRAVDLQVKAMELDTLTPDMPALLKEMGALPGTWLCGGRGAQAGGHDLPQPQRGSRSVGIALAHSWCQRAATWRGGCSAQQAPAVRAGAERRQRASTDN